MALSIKNDTAERLARQVAAETGRRSAPDLVETLLAISRRCSALPDLDTRTADEILGYDEAGGPTPPGQLGLPVLGGPRGTES